MIERRYALLIVALRDSLGQRLITHNSFPSAGAPTFSMEEEALMQRTIRLAVVSVVVAAGCAKPAPAKLPPPVVRVAILQTRPVEQLREWLATLDGAINADIRPHVVGYVRSVDYQEGSIVKPGTLLFTIDDRPFVAAVDKARGDLENAEAQLGKSRADVARFTPLVAEDANPRQPAAR